jgi:hypothetical protein
MDKRSAEINSHLAQKRKSVKCATLKSCYPRQMLAIVPALSKRYIFYHSKVKTSNL